jgi:hypothetical protein
MRVVPPSGEGYRKPASLIISKASVYVRAHPHVTLAPSIHGLLRGSYGDLVADVAIFPLVERVRLPHQIEGMVGVVAAGRRFGLPAERRARNRDCRRVVHQDLRACAALAASAVLIRSIPRRPALNQSQD